ncbi:GumC family protein [Pedobacter sp. UC225_61]|uniref:GumC family protein n=1 Tax=Pedobacter sp. UC225_61 TaxID=3374623 RepID=UPI00378E9F60
MNNPEILQHTKSVRQDIDFYKIFKVFFSRWYWIAGCVIIALIIARINILYTPPMYQTSASLKLQERNPTINTMGGDPSQAYNYTDRIQAEGVVIKSNDVILNAISNLDYKISYYIKGTIRTTELYPRKPFEIEIIKQDSVDFSRFLYQVEAVNPRTFTLISENNGPKKEYHYGDTLKMGNMIFRIKSQIPSGSYSFKFNSKEDFIGRASGISISEMGNFTNIMLLTQTDSNPVFAADILNSIMKEYVAYDIIEKRRSAEQTIEFIESQLGFLNKKADTAGSNLANYKIKNKMVDLSASSQLNASKLSALETQKSEVNIELIGINELENQINNNRDKIKINFDLEGNISGLLSGLIGQLNALISTREQKLTQFRPNSEPIQELDKQISDVKIAIKNNIRSLKERNLKLMRYFDNQIALVNQSISQIPGKEKDFVQFQSNFDVNNKVLTYLSEKKLESELNAAAIVAGAAIVNKAFPDNVPISPVKNKIYSFAAMIGLACGFGLILLVRFLNPYIYDKETVEALTNTPIIGVIRKFPEYIDKDNRQALSISKPKSVFAESVRSVRTNLSFLASNKKSKTICITSEVSGEGKSFVTVNLAGTLALIDKKVILIAADLRKSKLHKVFGSDNKVGLSSYLIGQKTLEEVIIHDDVHGIDFIPSGPVPPNPSELLHTESMKKLLEILAPQYDYVLVDTAPVGLVSDAIPLIRQSDVNLFVIRSGKSQFRAAAIPERLSREYGLSNLAIVLNAFGDDALHSNYYTTDYARGGGNSTYYYSDYSGYAGSGYYEEDPKKWWEFWKKK